MSLTQRLVASFERWLDRVVASDERFICGACDDRFRSRSLGIEHVLRCHPEYQGVVVVEGSGAPRPAGSAPTTRPAWTPVPAGLTPASVHAHGYSPARS